MKNILIACEESQRVTLAFRAAGFNAFSCDLQSPSGGDLTIHIRCDVRELLHPPFNFVTMDGVVHHVPCWDLIIAHPPCTFLTAASAVRLFNSDHTIRDSSRYKQLLDARSFFYEIYNCDCPRICIENPAPLSICDLPWYDQIIEPYYFGDPWKKRTCLWLKNLPPLVPDDLVQPLGCWVYAGGVNSRVKLRELHGVSSSKDRSKTFPGVARAMVDQWAPILDTYPIQLSLI